MQVLTGLSDREWTEFEAQFKAENERIQAFLPEEGRFERLRHEAAELEKNFPVPGQRPALYGLTVGVKDIFHAGGFLTRAGSKLPVEEMAGPEADSVTRLKEAGALIVGKTVTTEFAYFGPGPTRNPHDPAHTPGGSSSGSAAAVAAGMCGLALGTQTIGSILRPASFCGVVGFKPSFGRISTAGVIPLSPSLDHVGFFSPNVSSAIEVAKVLCYNWQPIEQGERPVLGVPAGPYLQRASKEGLAHFEASEARLQAAGFKVRRVEAMADFEEIAAQHQALMAAEAETVHRAWFARYRERYHPKTAALIERGRQVTPEQVKAYRAGREKLRRELLGLMAQHSLSAWIAPAATGPAPVGLESTGDPIMNLPWTYAGLPAISVPSGYASNGLPIGLQIVAGWQEDERLLAWAREIKGLVGQA